jgi:aryl-alcohol dehydrogenase-like predicted oxidoreductase
MCAPGPLQVSGYGRQPYLREGGKLPRVDAENIEYAVDRSLQRLGTDHVDLLQVHWPDRCVCVCVCAGRWQV